MKTKIISKLFMVTAFLFFAGSANANINLIVDGNFSSSNVTPGNYAYSNNITGSSWLFSNNSGISNYAYQWGSAANSNSVAFLQSNNSLNIPTISQVFTSSSNIFILSFDLAQRDNFGGTENLKVTVDGHTVVANLSAGTGNLNSHIFNVTGLTGSSHILEFQGVNPSYQPDSSLLLTNVSVIAVPEPETYAMLLTGLGLMGFMVRRRKTS